MTVRVAFLAMLLSACGGPQQVRKDTLPEKAEPRCIQLGQAEVDAAARAEEGNAAAFRAAMRRLGLKPSKLAHDMLFTAGRPEAQAPVDVVLTRDALPMPLQVDGDIRWVATLPFSAPCGGYDDFTEFAIDDERRVWRILRKPRIVSETTHQVCGCQSSFPGCVGPAHTPASEVQTLFRIPEGATYAGVREVPYDVRRVHLQHTQHDAEGRFLRCSIPG